MAEITASNPAGCALIHNFRSGEFLAGENRRALPQDLASGALTGYVMLQLFNGELLVFDNAFHQIAN